MSAVSKLRLSQRFADIRRVRDFGRKDNRYRGLNRVRLVVDVESQSLLGLGLNVAPRCMFGFDDDG